MSSDEDAEFGPNMPSTSTSQTFQNKKRSLIWDFFLKKDSVAECNTCKKSLKIHKTGTTTPLTNHLKTHSKVYDDFSVKKRKQEEISNLNKKQKTDPSGKTQTTVANLFSPKLPHSSKRYKDLTKAITLMMAKDLHSFSLVNEASFCNLMKIAEPRYEIPHRTTFSRSILPELYLSEKKKLKDRISEDMEKGVQSMSLTTDNWTSRAGDSYMSFTLHYVDENFIFKNYVLGNKFVPESHTADNLLTQLKEIVMEWEINSNEIPLYVVSDNARNITAALERSEWNRIACFAHTLQLAIEDAQKEAIGVKDLMKQARRIVGHYKHSTSAMTRLRKAQDQLNIPKHELIQDVVTRWNSELDMLERLQEQKEAVSFDLSSSNDDVENLSKNQWKLVSGIVEVLSPFKEATTDLCAEKYPTLSMVIPVLHCLNAKLLQFILKADHGSGLLFARSLAKSLKSRFPMLCKGNETYIVATGIDPRYKMSTFTQQEKEHATLLIINWCNRLTGPYRTRPPKGSSIPAEEKKASVWDVLDDASVEAEADIEDSDIKTEIDFFFKTPRLDRNGDVFLWWRENSARYPHLVKVSKLFLGIPATQVSSERLFSTSSNIVTCRRENLTTEHVEELCFLHGNIEI